MRKICDSCMHFIICIISILIISACSDSVEGEVHSVPKTNDMEYYKIQGETHNQFLSNLQNYIKKERDTRGNISQDDFIESIHNENLRYVDSLELNEDDKKVIKQNLNKYKRYYKLDALKEDLFPNNSLDSIFVIFNKIADKGVMDNFDLQIIKELTVQTYNNLYELNNDKNFVSEVNNLYQTWELHYSAPGQEISISDSQSHFVGYILSITKSSTEWWVSTDLIDLPDDESVIARDAAGALIGATIHLVSQLAFQNNVNWTQVGMGALSGAVVASTGLVGRVARWF